MPAIKFTETDKAKQRGYAIASVMLAFISEFNRSETFGAVAMFFNKLSNKDYEFHSRIQEHIYKCNQATKKNKKFPKMSQALINYSTGDMIAARAWKQTIQENINV